MKLVILIVLIVNIARFESTSVLRCHVNEEYRCDYPCERSCSTLHAKFKCVSEQVCRCFCSPGHVRADESERCIPISDCQTCAVNQTYRASGIDCQTCKNYQFVKCALKEEFNCYCLDGYVLDESTGFCKSPLDCPVY